MNAGLVVKGVSDRIVPDRIPVCLSAGVESAVECRTNLVSRDDPDVVWQQIVESMNETVGRNGKRDVRVRSLPVGMHTGVCPSRTFDSNGLAAEPSDRGFDHLLNTDRIRLRLPASKASAEVLDGE